DQAVDVALGLIGDGGMAVGVANFSDPTVNAAQGPVFSGMPSTSQITVNVNGAFFFSGASLGSYNVNGATVPLPYEGGSAGAQALLLIHELAHMIVPAGYTDQYYGSPAAEASNNTLVMQNCVGVISRAQGVYAP